MCVVRICLQFQIVGNKNPTFLEQRREQLEKYLQELLVFFRIQLPKVLAEFLEFNKYDIIYLLQDLAKLFNENGDSLLSLKKEYNFSALEVYAISERLSLPCPPESIEQRGKYDFSHVLDFCNQLEVLTVTPVKVILLFDVMNSFVKHFNLQNDSDFGKDFNSIDVPIGRSNIIPKTLHFNLNAFRNLKILKFYGISMENVIDMAVLKSQIEEIAVHNTTITHLSQVLLCDNVHKYDLKLPPTKYITQLNDNDSTNSNHSMDDCSNTSLCTAISPSWQNLSHLDFTGNLLTQIDTSIRTATNLRKLVLEQNRIRNLQNLADLPHLQVLSLSVNLIADCSDWHLELGNLVTLKLAQNQIKHLKGLRKLLSLVNLDLSCNQIEDLEEVDNVACLPLLETLRLTGNPLAGSVGRFFI